MSCLQRFISPILIIINTHTHTSSRSALNFKQIPYETIWVEYPDIESVCKKIGAPPTTKVLALDGSGLMVDHYTLPVIHDAKTGKVIADSFAIAEYLDETYPDTPRLIPHGMGAAIAMFNYYVNTEILPHLGSLVLPTTQKRLNERSQKYFLDSREFWYQQKLEDLSPPGPKREELWSQVRKGLTTLAGFYKKNENEGSGQSVFFMGNTFTYADIVIGSFLCWPKDILFEEDFDWQEIANADDGLWGRIVDELEQKYRQVL